MGKPSYTLYSWEYSSSLPTYVNKIMENSKKIFCELILKETILNMDMIGFLKKKKHQKKSVKW